MEAAAPLHESCCPVSRKHKICVSKVSLFQVLEESFLVFLCCQNGNDLMLCCVVAYVFQFQWIYTILFIINSLKNIND